MTTDRQKPETQNLRPKIKIDLRLFRIHARRGVKMPKSVQFCSVLSSLLPCVAYSNASQNLFNGYVNVSAGSGNWTPGGGRTCVGQIPTATGISAAVGFISVFGAAIMDRRPALVDFPVPSITALLTQPDSNRRRETRRTEQAALRESDMPALPLVCVANIYGAKDEGAV